CIDSTPRRDLLDGLPNINQAHFADSGASEIITRIASYEMSYRMQTSVPELMGIDKEPRSIHEMYGTEPGKVSFANNCLLARRLLERGTRFVQIFHWGWDQHGDSKENDIRDGLARQTKQKIGRASCRERV